MWPTRRFFVYIFSMSWFDNSAPNEFFHNFITATIDSLYSRVSVGAGDGSFHHVTPASMQLKAARSHFILQIRCPIFGH